MTSQTTTLTSTETGFTYEITVDDGTATIAWSFEGDDNEIESGCPNGVLLACDVPTEDQGLIADAVHGLVNATFFHLVDNGLAMGAYPGADEDAALDAYAREAGYASFDDRLARVPGSSRSEVTITSIDPVLVLDVQAGDSHGAVDADLVVVVAGKPVSCSVTLWHDEGQPTVRRRHPLGTCGTERYGWADGSLDGAFTEAEDADEDYDCSDTVDAIIYAVDESAIAAGI